MTATATLSHNPPFDQTADQELIEELRRRGYKIFREKRVKILRVGAELDRRSNAQPDDVKAKLIAQLWETMGYRLGAELMKTRGAARGYHDDKDLGIRRFSADVMVILPKSVDVEAAVWGDWR